MALLNVNELNAYYGKSHILQGVNISIDEGEIVSLLGRNGVGRSTTCKSIMGEVPFFETWPQLWVVNDLDYDRARQLIEAADAESPTEPWACPSCGEKNEGQFSVCWNCGAAADA